MINEKLYQLLLSKDKKLKYRAIETLSTMINKSELELKELFKLSKEEVYYISLIELLTRIDKLYIQTVIPELLDWIEVLKDDHFEKLKVILAEFDSPIFSPYFKIRKTKSNIWIQRLNEIYAQSIRRKLKSLHWNIAEEIQNRAIQDFVKKVNSGETDIRCFIVPGGLKEYGDNSARIITLVNEMYIIPVLDEILEWFLDVNWPGALILLEGLTKIEYEKIEPFIQTAWQKACESKDTEWMFGLELLLEKYNIPRS